MPDCGVEICQKFDEWVCKVRPPQEIFLVLGFEVVGQGDVEDLKDVDQGVGRNLASCFADQGFGVDVEPLQDHLQLCGSKWDNQEVEAQDLGTDGQAELLLLTFSLEENSINK